MPAFSTSSTTPPLRDLRASITPWRRPPPGVSAHEISTDKKFTRVSSGHFAVLGYKPADLLGRSVADYVVLKETAERAMSRKLSPTAVLLPYMRTFRKADGNEISLLLIDRHIKDAVGNVTGIRTAFAETPKL
ncbi:MAG: PAS domain-containing protein [Vicinamibacteria bacterium]